MDRETTTPTLDSGRRQSHRRTGNTFLGASAGATNAAGTAGIFINNGGVNNENNTIRIGDSANQQAGYIAGIYGLTSASGVPVYINSNGQLGT